MNDSLASLRNRLIEATIVYNKADSSLDVGSTQFIIAKADLKTARFEYNQACVEYIEEMLFSEVVE